MRKAELVILCIALLSIIIGIVAYPGMPAEMASHWGTHGEVNGYMSRFWGVFLLPIISVGMFILFMLLVRVDPLKQNLAEFRRHYDGFLLSIMLFLFYLYVLTLMWNIGVRFNMVQLLAPAFAVLFFYCGIVMDNAKRNWFLGIRTPWTMSSEYVWNKTHKLGAVLFKLCGILSLLGVLFWKYAIWFIIVPVIMVAIFTFFYSYYAYKKEEEMEKSGKKSVTKKKKN
jgi:uncharacterized membrane protein